MRNKLVVGAALGKLFKSAVQISKLGHALSDRFPVETQEHAKHAVRSRVLRTHVENHIVLKRVFKHCNSVFVLDFTQDLGLTELFYAFNRS